MNNTNKENEAKTSKKFTQEQKELLKSVFAANKKEKKVLLVGNEVFLLKNKSYALNYSVKEGRVKRDKPLEIVYVSKADIEK